jgi:hypothetical protein
MPDETPEPNDVVKNDARAYNTYDNGHRSFKPGNPGRPFGAKDTRSKSAQEIIDAFATEPLVVKMQQLLRLQAKVAKAEWTYPGEEIETEKLLERLTSDIMQYRHTKLKSVESHTQLDIVHKLQSLDEMSDAELRQVLEEVQQVTRKQIPGG